MDICIVIVDNKFTIFIRGDSDFFKSSIVNTDSSAAAQIPLCQRMLGLDPVVGVLDEPDSAKPA
jgi:hypothetical protein